MNRVGLGGSCHWCTEAIFQSLKGVEKVDQGWISSVEFPSMSEAVVVHFDSNIIPMEVLIEIHLQTHSCTSNHPMREKYRSAVYVYNNKQSKQAKNVIKDLKPQFEKSIITKVLTFQAFKINKEEYLDYYFKNPEKAFCKTQINPKLKKLIALFASNVDSCKLKL